MVASSVRDGFSKPRAQSKRIGPGLSARRKHCADPEGHDRIAWGAVPNSWAASPWLV